MLIILENTLTLLHFISSFELLLIFFYILVVIYLMLYYRNLTEKSVIKQIHQIIQLYRFNDQILII